MNHPLKTKSQVVNETMMAKNITGDLGVKDLNDNL